jgi:dTDP-glucose 4,6-dehydratase
MAAERFLVIGSNSFTGAHFVAQALAGGAEVVGISRSPEPATCFLPYRWKPHDKFTFRQIDLNHDLKAALALVESFKPDYVVNFAAQGMVPQSWSAPRDWLMTNTVAMVDLHDGLRKFKFIKKFVQASTPEVYGNTSGLVNETAPYNPSTPYAVSKAACDMSLMAFQRAYGFPVALTRSANVCGPAQLLFRIIPRAVLCVMAGEKLQLQGGGTSVRSFIHIRDVCDGTLQVAREAQPGEIFHFSTDRIVSIRQLVEMICAMMNVPFEKVVEITEGRLGLDAAYTLDAAKARRVLGWRDRCTLENILQETIDWMRERWDEIRVQPRAYVHRP